MGTIWSSSPWMTRVGMSNFFRSARKSVDENAAMESYVFLWPACMPCAHQLSIRPCETFAPGRLKP